MKSRKLFAILTLIAFMMTLLPVAAFATADRFASAFEVNKTTATANGTDKIKLTVYALNYLGQAQSGAQINFASNRSIDRFYSNSSLTTLISGTDGHGQVTVGTDGKAEIWVATNTPGAAKLAFSIAGSSADLQTHLNGTTTAGILDAHTLRIIGIKDVNFNLTTAGSIGLTATGTPKANGVDEFTVTATLYSQELLAGQRVAGQVIDFSVNKTGVNLSKTTGVTNALGQVEVKVTGQTTETVRLTATSGSNTESINLTFGNAGAFDVQTVSNGDQKVAVNTATETIRWAVTDISGNRLSSDAARDAINAGSAKIVTKPAASSLSEDITVTSSTLDRAGFVFTPDVAGEYVIRVALTNGKSATAKVVASAQGPITTLSFKYSQNSLGHGENSGAADLRYRDANGVGSPVTGTLTYASSNPLLATITNATTGVVTATSVIERAGKVTITAIDSVRGLSASYDLNVGTEPITFTASGTTAVSVGEAAKVKVQLVDQSGNKSNYQAGDSTRVTFDVIVVSKPAGALVDISMPNQSAYRDSLTKGGAVDFTVKSDKAGEVVVQVIGYNGKAAAADQKTINTVVKTTFGAPKVVVGAKEVTMFIGASGYMQDGAAKMTDVAPFIKDGRTFVAIRPVADAFGAEIGWNEATQTVTLSRADITVTIKIGSSAITVVKAGVTSTVTADVPAFIKDGRTVLPFRAVGEAFGATATPGFNADGTVAWVKYVQ